MNKFKKTEFSFGGKLLTLYKVEEGEYSVIKDSVEWYTGPRSFNLFYVDFDGLLVDKVENIIKEDHRIRDNTPDLHSLSFVSDEAQRLIEDLVRVVNYSSRPVISEDRKIKYSQILKKISAKLGDYRKDMNLGTDMLTIVPMKGGSYFLEFLDGKKVYPNVLAIECKRIPLRNERSFGFGMRVDVSDKFLLNNDRDFYMDNENYKRVRIIELCIVSGMTTIGFLLYLLSRGIRPEIVEIDTISMSQQGYETIKKFADNIGVKVEFVTGGLFYRLGNFYASLRDELLTLDGKLVIGDVRKFLD